MASPFADTRPTRLVERTIVRPVGTCRIVTDTSGRSAPAASMTRTCITDVVVCACAWMTNNVEVAKATSTAVDAFSKKFLSLGFIIRPLRLEFNRYANFWRVIFQNLTVGYFCKSAKELVDRAQFVHENLLLAHPSVN